MKKSKTNLYENFKKKMLIYINYQNDQKKFIKIYKIVIY